MKDFRVTLLRDILGYSTVWIPEGNKLYKLYQLEQIAVKCKKCPLYATRNKFVFGWGNPYSGIMAVGEAPGPEEDELGKPFVGRAGEFLDYAMREAGIDRERDLYLANVLKCFPIKITNGNHLNGKINGNPQPFRRTKAFREPHPSEIKACSNWLEAQISIIKPKFILAMGNPSIRYFLGPNVNISFIAGQPRKIRGGEITVFPIHHPSFIIRNKTPENEKRYIELLKKFREVVGDLIPR
ncbi:MAG: uracil-DNA glycosylase [candidate division WOR-3 bacterium]